VEGQTGHAATGTASSKVVPLSNSMSKLVITSGGASCEDSKIYTEKE
jgi:hypothetical protein